VIEGKSRNHGTTKLRSYGNIKSILREIWEFCRYVFVPRKKTIGLL